MNDYTDFIGADGRDAIDFTDGFHGEAGFGHRLAPAVALDSGFVAEGFEAGLVVDLDERAEARRAEAAWAEELEELLGEDDALVGRRAASRLSGREAREIGDALAALRRAEARAAKARHPRQRHAARKGVEAAKAQVEALAAATWARHGGLPQYGRKAVLAALAEHGPLAVAKRDIGRLLAEQRRGKDVMASLAAARSTEQAAVGAMLVEHGGTPPWLAGDDIVTAAVGRFNAAYSRAAARAAAPAKKAPAKGGARKRTYTMAQGREEVARIVATF